MLNIAGSAKKPAIKYERKRLGPVFEEAMPGKINNPELIIAPDAIEKTSKRPNSFFSLSSTIIILSAFGITAGAADHAPFHVAQRPAAVGAYAHHIARLGAALA